MEVIEEREPLTGLAIPALRKLYPGTDTAVPEDNRLSDGEKKTFYLINLILQIELLSKSGEPWHVVFDDAVDSFDYRNKYAFLQYLADLAPRIKKGQVFVLTHSFDFYRGLIHTLRSLTRSEYFSFKQNVGQFWLKKDLGGILVMDSAAVEDYVDFGKLSSWKHQAGERFFALLRIESVNFEDPAKGHMGTTRFSKSTSLTFATPFSMAIPKNSIWTKSFVWLWRSGVCGNAF